MIDVELVAAAISDLLNLAIHLMIHLAKSSV